MEEVREGWREWRLEEVGGTLTNLGEKRLEGLEVGEGRRERRLEEA